MPAQVDTDVFGPELEWPVVNDAVVAFHALHTIPLEDDRLSACVAPALAIKSLTIDGLDSPNPIPSYEVVAFCDVNLNVCLIFFVVLILNIDSIFLE